MTPGRLILIALLAIGTLASAGCFGFGRKAKLTTPTVPAPTPTPVQEPAQPPPAKPPEPVAEPQPPAEQPVVQPQQQPIPSPQPVPRVKSPRPKPAIVTPPPQPQPQPPPHAPAPVFGAILTPEQQAQLLRTYEQSAQAARRALAQTAGKSLTQEQSETVTRIRSFLKQADDAKGSDPSTAAQLARRAESLATTLVNSLP